MIHRGGVNPKKPIEKKTVWKKNFFYQSVHSIIANVSPETESLPLIANHLLLIKWFGDQVTMA